MNIYDIVKKEKLDVVNNPIEKAHGLPNECYNNIEYTKIERKKLFEDKWVVIGVASSIPKPGDAKPFDLLGIPLILLRNKKNQVKVYHNVCSHRGYKILQKKCSIKNVIRCPYHSWSYDLDGELVATPHLGGMDKHESIDFDKTQANENSDVVRSELKSLRQSAVAMSVSQKDGANQIVLDWLETEGDDESNDSQADDTDKKS